MKRQSIAKRQALSFDDYCRTQYDYNPETGVITSRYYGKPVGCKTEQGYLRLHSRGRLIAVHRLAWFLHYGVWPKLVDHINRDRADNRISNMRETSCEGNARNRKLHPCSSGFKGVTVRPGGWGARIYDPKRGSVWLGVFPTKDQAARAYDEAAKQIQGEFAATNEALGLLNWTTAPADEAA